MVIYGYVRISTKKQNIERQIKNIKEKYPNAIIIKEIFTGTRQDRPEWQKLLKVLKKGDIIVFDEVSRMSRNAKEGFDTYKYLFEMGIELVFLKENHINTESYKNAMKQSFNVNVESGDSATDEFINTIMDAINKFVLNKVEKDIYLAFEKAQSEIDYLHQRTREGLAIAKMNGKQIGQQKGKVLNIKKKAPIKAEIKAKSRDFNGTYTDADLIKVLGIARNTYFKYKKELRMEMEFAL